MESPAAKLANTVRRQPDGHGGGDSGLAVEHARERRARDPQMGCCRGHGQVSRILAENLAGMGWIWAFEWMTPCSCDQARDPSV